MKVSDRQSEREVAHGDLAVAQLAFQGAVAVDLEGVEEDLAVGRFNHEVLIFPVHGLVHGRSLGVLVGTHPERRHTRVLGGGGVLEEWKSHAWSGHPSLAIVEVRPQWACPSPVRAYTP